MEQPERPEARSTIFPQAWYGRDTVAVARDLLGCRLVCTAGPEPLVGRIVETEAYLAGDPAAHSYRGPTRRNAVLFGPVGHAYVYFIYGAHHCLNAVTGPAGRGEAVLIRALEPLAGLDVMAERRGVADPRALCSGPGKLAQAFGITLADNGVPLYAGPLHVEAAPPGGPAAEVASGPRVGITRAREAPLRFWLAGNRFVSRR